MFLLACGRGSVTSSDTVRDIPYEPLPASDSTTSEPMGLRITWSLPSTSDAWRRAGRSYSDREHEATGPVTMTTTASGRALTKRSSCGQLDTVISNYDSMAARLQSANREDFPALWTALRKPRRRKEKLTSTPDADEIPIPDLHVGFYQYYCPLQTWSPVFASPGDFTIRMDSVQERRGTLLFRLAIICCCVTAVRDGTREQKVNKRKSYIKHIERSEHDLIRFSETISLKYLGHHLMDKLPKPLSYLTASQRQLDEYGTNVVSFLSYVLTITEIGYSGLVVLSEPVVKNIFVREFLDLSLSFGEPGAISTSSCDARIERRNASRPVLPSSWLDTDGFDPSQMKASSMRAANSPLDDSMIPFGTRSGEYAGFLDWRTRGNLSPRAQLRNYNASTGSSTTTSKCIRFVHPQRWHHEKFMDGVFTIEITAVTVLEGHACFTISILYYSCGRLEISTVDHRFSEFDALVGRIESKVRSLQLRSLVPPKTFFRYLSASYLEHRAESLQLFLERLLSMQFLGILEQDIPMVAEPNVRAFLKLPAVEWSIVPWASLANGMGRPNRHRTRFGPQNRQFSAYSTASTTTAAEASPSLAVYSPASDYRYFAPDQDTTPRYEELIRRRSDSL